MSQYKALISCPLIQDAIEEYYETFDEHDVEYDAVSVGQHLSESELLDIIDQYDGVLAGDDEFTARVLEHADRLKVISKWGIGVDSINLAAAKEEGIEVYNTPGAFADEVGDIVIGYAIMLTRRLHHIDRQVRNGEWACPRGVSLADKTFGVIGVGSIGSSVARRASALGMDVLGHDIEPLAEDLKKETGIERVGKDELLRRSDVVSLNCALNEATREIIGSHELDILGENGYLINTARGHLVDQSALVDALSNDEIAGAALDVFVEEPLPENDPLTELDNVILGSHNAQNTNEAVADVNERAVENLIDGLEG